MGKLYDVCVARRDEKADKTYWTKIGAVIETKNGRSIKLETIPLAWDGWASLFEPKAKEGGQERPKAPPADDDAPW